MCMYWSVQGSAVPQCHFLIVIPNSVHSDTETLIILDTQVYASERVRSSDRKMFATRL